MNNHIRRRRTLIDVVVYEATASEIGAIKKKADHQGYFTRSLLPEFCVRTDNNYVTRSEYYLQWIEEGDEEYILFDAHTTDKLLGEEISLGGFDELVAEIDFKKCLEGFNRHLINDKYLTLRESEYLIIDLIYSGYGEDTELHVEVIGKLDLNKI